MTTKPKPIKENVFDMPSEETAYLLGFSLVKAYLLPNFNKVTYRILEQDKDILVYLNSLLCENDIIFQQTKRKNIQKTQGNFSVLQFSNKTFYQKLISFGCGNKKELTISKTLFEYTNDHLPSFLKGIFDGNGTITPNKKGGLMLSITGSQKFLIELQRIIKDKYEIDSTMVEKKSVFNLRINKQLEIKIFLDLIYKDSNIICNRLYQKYICFLEYFKSCNRKFHLLTKNNELAMIDLYQYIGLIELSNLFDIDQRFVKNILISNNVKVRKHSSNLKKNIQKCSYCISNTVIDEKLLRENIKETKCGQCYFRFKKKYLEENTQDRLRMFISSRIWFGLKSTSSSKNNKSCLDFLGYSIQDLKQHLERQFEPWMTWENWGKYYPKTFDENPTWQIDHIIPHSHFSYTSMEDEQFQKCWSLSNLRPLSAKQNVIDGNRRKF